MLLVLIRIASLRRLPRWGDSKEHPQHRNLWRFDKIIFQLTSNKHNISLSISSVGLSKEEIDRLEKEEEAEEAEREKNTRRNLLEDLENRFEQVTHLVKTYSFHK